MVRPGARPEVEACSPLAIRIWYCGVNCWPRSGRSRLYINDVLSSQESLRDLRARLVTHTSQHGQQQLLQPAFQAKLMESAFPRPELLEERDALLRQLQEVSARRNVLSAKQASLADGRDLLEMQRREIDKVSPEEGEEEHLEELRAARRASVPGRIMKTPRRCCTGRTGPGLLDMLGRFERLIHTMSRDDAVLAPEAEAAAALRQQLVHLGQSFARPPAR